MKKFLIGIVKRIDTLVAIAAISLIVIGVGMYSVQAAIIVAGALFLIDVYLSKLRLKHKK